MQRTPKRRGGAETPLRPHPEPKAKLGKTNDELGNHAQSTRHPLPEWVPDVRLTDEG